METNQNEFLKKWTRVWIITVMLLISILGIIALINVESNHTRWIISLLLVTFYVFYLKWGFSYWHRKFIKSGLADDKGKNPYRNMFFGGVNILSIVLLTIGILGAFYMMLEQESDIFGALGLIIIVIWAVIFLRYFTWAIYFYNINYGLTDNDWDIIFKAQEDKRLGLDVTEKETKEPKHNPYRSQTFGLPPGTVRGMIAFTLLFGAISMLVVSMGKEGEIRDDSFFWDHFEFFKTAFLMMIAFYFGDKSLKYLQKRWPSVNQAERKKSGTSSGNEPDDDIAEDDEEYKRYESGIDDYTPPDYEVSPTRIKNLLVKDTDDEEIDIIAKEYNQIADNESEKFLSADIIEAKANDNNIDPAALHAVIKIESAGSGFLPNGKPKILFEGHKFWHWLTEMKENPNDYLPGNEDILYKVWTRNYYKGGEKEYERFQKAYNIHPLAAVYSTSWGLFQILGENFKPGGYCKNRLKYKSVDEQEEEPGYYYVNESGELDVKDFIEKMGQSEKQHLMDFFEYIKEKTVRHNEYKGTLFNILKKGKESGNYNWQAFAFGYNGSGYKRNNYHYKLQKAYESYKQA